MFPLLLLLAAIQENGDSNSPALSALMAQRASLGDAVFTAKARALAEGGDASAAELMGELYQFGAFGVPHDSAKACDWYERAAPARGDSTHNLARCYEMGDGRPADPAKARILYGQGAARGYIQSKCALGTMLVRGTGGPVEAARGVTLCREAAEAGNANAQADYGGYLLMGEATRRDVVAARLWLTKAAEQNQANAAFVLAQIYWNGDGTPVDRAAAARWWRVAWDQGRKDAAMWLARELLKRIAPDGKTIADRSLFPQWIAWLKAAKAEDPDPEVRKSAADMLATMEQ